MEQGHLRLSTINDECITQGQDNELSDREIIGHAVYQRPTYN